MTPSVAEYFRLLDASITAGGELTKVAVAMIDTITTGEPLEKAAAGVTGRWRIEARQELRRRTADSAQPSTGNRSEDARMLRAALMRYAGSGQFARDQRAGGPPAEKNAALFMILQDAGGHVPAARTLRRRLKSLA